MRRRLAGLTLVLALVSCAATPADGTQAWGADNCLYTYLSGVGWTTVLDYCRTPVSAGVWRYHVGAVDLGLVDTSDPQVTVYTESTSGVSYGIRNADGAYMIRTDFGWVTQDAYLAALAAAQQQPQAPPPPQAQAPGVQEGTPAWQVQAMIDEVNARVISRILAPDCVGSYNGCR